MPPLAFFFSFEREKNLWHFSYTIDDDEESQNENVVQVAPSVEQLNQVYERLEKGLDRFGSRTNVFYCCTFNINPVFNKSSITRDEWR